MDSINNEILWIFIGLFSFLIIASIIGAILAALKVLPQPLPILILELKLGGSCVSFLPSLLVLEQ